MPSAASSVAPGVAVIADTLLVVGYFFGVTWLGLRWSRDRSGHTGTGEAEAAHSLSEYALGGRRVPWWAVLVSIIAAETSAGTFLGTPGEGYALRNWTYLQLAIGLVLGRVVVAFLFLRPYYEYQVYSIYEFLGKRFGPLSRKAASATFLFTRLLASGTRLYVAAIVLAVLFRIWKGGDLTQGQELGLYLGAITLMTVLTALYTALGGIRAVIWTDVLQCGLMMGGAVAALVILYTRIPGGLGAVEQALGGWGAVPFVDWGTKAGAGFFENVRFVLEGKYTLWAAFLGSTFTTMATHGTDQDMVQRMLCAPDFKKSRRSLILSGLTDLPIVFIFLAVGILLWVFYQKFPDASLPKKTNEIFAYFILKEMPVGLRGLVVAGVFATAMGSLSAALNALATSFTRDWHLPWVAKARAASGVMPARSLGAAAAASGGVGHGGGAGNGGHGGAGGHGGSGGHGSSDDAEALRAARKYTFVFSVLMILVACATAYLVILYPESRIIPIALGVFGYTYGSLLGVFLLGTLTKGRGSDRGNLIAMVAGAIVVLFLSGTPGFPSGWIVVSFPWRVMIGTIVTFGVGACFKSAGNTTPGKLAG